MARPPFTRRELEDRLDDLLFTVLSSRRTAASIAAGLAPLPRPQQEFVLHWAQVAAQNTGELGYQVAAQAPQAFALFDRQGMERWVLDALDVYDREGLHAASAALRDFGALHRRVEQERSGVALGEMARTLELYLRGLSGRALAVEPSDAAWTDTATVFLPERIGALPSREDNRRLYTATAAFLWGQARYGTFNADLEAATAFAPQRERALQWLAVLEAIRIEGWFARHYAGLARLLASLREPWPASLAAAAGRLSQPQATVSDSVAELHAVQAEAPPAPPPWAGVLRPSRARRVREERMAKEQRDLARELAALRETLQGEGKDPQELALDASYETLEVSMSVDGEAVDTPAAVEQLVQSMIQDHGSVPDDLLVPAGDGPYGDEAAEGRAAETDPRHAASHGEGGILYPEWDHRRGDYRKEWCALFESDVPRGDPGYVDHVREKYRGAIVQLKRRFEALRGEDRLLRREPDGDGIDFDALVEAWADAKSGREPSARLFTLRRRTERNIAVMFMVDMSGSTKGWVNECEREALVMLCEALGMLGDRYAIYGFSGWTRKRCEIYRVKRFDEPFGEAVRGRIAGVAPKDYTRMGVAVRHLTKLLNAQEARTRVLFTLSDGKPDDFHDGYRGTYGIEDTRKALIEARQSGVHPFCITIDREARDYLPRLYGPASWTLVDDVRKLPLKSAEVYRRLTA